MFVLRNTHAMPTEKIYIIIPAYNEENQIKKVIVSLKEAGYPNILVINDGSTDKTSLQAKDAGVSVIDHLMNLGQGAALRTGIEYLRENQDPDIIVTFDADGQHRAEDIKKLIHPLDEGYDVVLGSRFLGTKVHAPFLRKCVLKLGILFTNIVSHVSLTDTHNGLRAFGKKASHAISLTQNGMEHASEIIEEISRKKLRYTEAPVEILYTNYSQQKGQGNLNGISIVAKTLFKKIIR